MRFPRPSRSSVHGQPSLRWGEGGMGGMHVMAPFLLNASVTRRGPSVRFLAARLNIRVCRAENASNPVIYSRISRQESRSFDCIFLLPSLGLGLHAEPGTPNKHRRHCSSLRKLDSFFTSNCLKNKVMHQYPTEPRRANVTGSGWCKI